MVSRNIAVVILVVVALIVIIAAVIVLNLNAGTKSTAPVLKNTTSGQIRIVAAENFWGSMMRAARRDRTST